MRFGERLSASLPTSQAGRAARVGVTRTPVALRLGRSIVTGIGLVFAIAGALAYPEGMPPDSLATRVTVLPAGLGRPSRRWFRFRQQA
jgi:hypothetical protein